MTFDVQALSETAEILELRARYGRALDEKDWDLMRTIFTDDASVDFGLGQPFEGFDSILQACRAVMESLARTQHFFGNHEIELDGDRARGRLKFIGSSFLSTEAGAPNACLRGDYIDEYVRTDAGWRVSKSPVDHRLGGGKHRDAQRGNGQGRQRRPGLRARCGNATEH